MMHDCGALTLGEELAALEFEADLGPSWREAHARASTLEIGRLSSAGGDAKTAYKTDADCVPLLRAAEVVVGANLICARIAGRV